MRAPSVGELRAVIGTSWSTVSPRSCPRRSFAFALEVAAHVPPTGAKRRSSAGDPPGMPHNGDVPRLPRPPARSLATSPFTREEYAPPSTDGFAVGDRVTLDSWGMGRVTEVTP